MKPQKLILCGWGPYKEKQEIDFSKLQERGLFLITGATGAGKTTIFDTITYALYGNMSGDRREKNSVRSDFAGSDMLTYVELFMQHGTQTYHIYRNPEYLRPKKRKTGTEEFTKEKERAVLTFPEGSKVEGASEVTRKIQELLRLDFRQFKQLSMIAQGEFARLLTATSSEKSKIFREIFDTEIYDRMAGQLRAMSGKLYAEVMEYRHKMEEDVALFVPDEEDAQAWAALTEDGNYHYEGILAFLEQVRERILKQSNSLSLEIAETEAGIEKLTAQIAEGEHINRLLRQREELEAKRLLLTARKAEMCLFEKELLKALSAREVSVFEEKWKQIASVAETACQKQKEAELELGRLSPKKEEGARFFELQKTLKDAYELKEKMSLSESRLSEAQALKEQQEAHLLKVREAYLEAEKKQALAKEEYERTERGYRLQIAGILAADLEEGMECPVCGSSHHPKKAAIENEMITEQLIEEKKALFEESRQWCMQMHGEAILEKQKLEANVQKLLQCREEFEECRRQEADRDGFVADYADTHEKTLFEQELKAYEALLVSITHVKSALEERKKEAETYRQEAAGLLLQFKEKRTAAFSTEEEYKAAFKTEQEIRKMQDVLQDYQTQVQENEVSLRQLTEQTGDRKPVLLDEMRDNLQKKKDSKAELLLREKAGSHSLKNAENLANALEQKLEITGRLSEKYGRIKRLDDTANGNNKMRLMFEQYVLAAYFDEILNAANVRLRVMSTGRYELRRVNEVVDGRSKDNLEMEVFDYYTGKYRSVKTLSGGETFKVSLALALGMSDVVQAGSGGIRVETLFVDEGFGSLDSESLEQACITLQSLVEKDRLIGIISHVPELSEKIANRIQIHKTGAGSNAEVVVS